MSSDGEYQAAIGRGGWVRVFGVEGDPFCLVRFELDGDLLVIGEVYVDGRGWSALKVPIRQLQEWAGSPDVSPVIRRELAFPSADLRTASRFYSTSFTFGRANFTKDGRGKDWAVEMWASQIAGRGVPRPVPPSDPSPRQAVDAIDLRLNIPTGEPFGDAFYRELADLYRVLVSAGASNPNTRIATANSVPPGRVARWITRARDKGLLGPATKGKAGS